MLQGRKYHLKCGRTLHLVVRLLVPANNEIIYIACDGEAVGELADANEIIVYIFNPCLLCSDLKNCSAARSS